jgi:chromosome segregation ATPase
MSDERFSRIENQLQSHEKDIHSIAKSLDGINSHMQKANELMQESILKDERINSRMDKLENHLSNQIKNNHEAITRAHERTDKIEGVFSRLAWTVISLVVVALVGLVVKVGV